MAALKTWDGSSWRVKPPKLRDPSTFVTKPWELWNGSAWVTIANSVRYPAISNFGYSLRQDGTACGAGTERQYDFWWTANGDVLDAEDKVEIDTLVDGSVYWTHVQEDPSAVHEYIGADAGCVTIGGSLHQLSYAWRLYYNGTLYQSGSGNTDRVKVTVCY